MTKHRLVGAVAGALALTLAVASGAAAFPSDGPFAHRPGAFGQVAGHQAAAQAAAADPVTRVTTAYADQVAFESFQSNPLGMVNGIFETRSEDPTGSSFSVYSGVEGLRGSEEITIFGACQNSATNCEGGSPEPGQTTDVGLDECNPCAIVGPTGEVVATGTIAMNWWSTSGEKPYQQVALLRGGTGALASFHGILTHPGAEDERCAQDNAAEREGFVGCYAGTIQRQECLSGTRGALSIGPGQSVCIYPGTRIFGPTHVARGGELFASGVDFMGGINSQHAAGISLCGSTVDGHVKVTGTTGPVMIGEPATGTCGGNTIFGDVDVSHNGDLTGDSNELNSGAVDVSGNTIVGSLEAVHDEGPFVLGYFTANSVSGPVRNLDNG